MICTNISCAGSKFKSSRSNQLCDISLVGNHQSPPYLSAHVLLNLLNELSKRLTLHVIAFATRLKNQ